MLYYLRICTLIALTLLITPALVLLSLVLLSLNLLHMLLRSTRHSAPSEESAPAPAGLASIIILNWNGKELLEQCLPSVVDAVLTDGRQHEILVVDNGSTDQSIDFLQTEFPDVRILALSENLGFAAGNNAGVRAARHDVVVLLNNDMVVDRGFLRPLLNGFGPNTFAVSSQIHHQDAQARREETGRTTAAFRRGMIDFSHRDLDGTPLPRAYYPTFWAGGGSSAFHRDRFLQLGGFLELYSPAYVEDTDLSYRAWKNGWDVLFAPESIVYHKHRASTSRRFTSLELQILIQRNQFLFIWSNVRSWRFLLCHCVFLPWNCYRLARDFKLRVWEGVLQAACRMTSTLGFKRAAVFRGVRSDREIFALFSRPGIYFVQNRTGSGQTIKTAPQDMAKESRPRILWITAYLPHTGRHAGAGRMLQLLSRVSRSYRITLLTFLESPEEKEYLPEVERFCERVVAMRRVPPPRRQLFAYEPFEEFRTPEMEAALQHCLEDYDYDLIQLEYSQMGCYADRSLGIPSLLTKHEVDFAACARRARVEPGLVHKLRWFYNYLQVLDREISLTRRADAAICMTEPDKQELQRFCRSIPVHVVNTGVDLDYFTPRERHGTEPRLVFVGAFQHLPNVDAMVYFCREILPRIRAKVPEVQLTVVGTNPPPAVMGLSGIPGVRVTGFVPDIRPFMAESAVYVTPLRLGVGIRGKVLEAWGMGMAVVATPVACAGLRCEEGRNLLVADSRDQFADHVVSLLKDPSLRSELGTEGRKTAERYYGWESSAARLEALYRNYIRPANALAVEGSQKISA